MKFNAANWLWLLLAVAALLSIYLLVQLRRKRYVARFTNVKLLGTVAPTRPGWRRHVAFTLILLALASMTVAMAKPTKNVKVPRDKATVMMVIDVSYSMKATDVTPNRLAAAQKAAKEFVEMLPDSINLGLVSFARSAIVEVSPTTNRGQVSSAIDHLQLGPSTATGDAILTALQSLQTFQDSIPGGKKDSDKVPSRVVLLSDGARTVGRPVEDGISAAKKASVPVSTIAFGTPNATVELDDGLAPVPVDRQTMKQIADGTGGSYHAAASASELQEVYQDIGSQIGYTTARREVTTWAVGVGLILAFLGTGVSLFWAGRFL